jgi:GT2 family glycosyltransferase
VTDLAILVPVLNRPHRVRPLVDSIRETTPDARVMFLCSDKGANFQAVQEVRSEFPNVELVVSGREGYAAKINQGLFFTTEPHLFLGADDLRFCEGWYEEAAAHLTDGVGVVGVNDLLPRQRDHTTHFLVTREYAQRGTIDEPDKLLHEGYHHWWVDDEFIATAKSRGAYNYAPQAIVEHLHPQGGKAPDDETYQRGRARIRQDKKHFARRSGLWT